MRAGKNTQLFTFAQQNYAFLMKTDYQNEIINKVRLLRQSKNISQAKLAAIIGVSTGQIGNIETPTRAHKYTLAQLSIVCDELGIPLENIFIDNVTMLSKDEIVKRLINSIIEYEK